MTPKTYTALVSVTTAGTKDDARRALDDHLAELDATHPTGTLTTGPAVLIDPLPVLAALAAIRDDARKLVDNTALTRGAPARRILQATDVLIETLSGTTQASDEHATGDGAS